MAELILGWDIGGAHLKAALLNQQGQILRVTQQACPLWQGLDQLERALKIIVQAFGDCGARHVVTMTGELVDLFPDRSEGVNQILQVLSANFAPESITLFAGRFGFIEFNQLQSEHFVEIASANWLATARYVALQESAGLLIDIGSTTTDILLFKDQSVWVQGYSDYQRLISEELVYTGIIRTAVMAVAQRALFNGHEQGLMAEYFATMADVYRLTGELCEAHDQTATADGGPKTLLASALRLSRMTGYDFVETDLGLWQSFARQLRRQQLQMIRRGCERQLSRQLLPADSCLVGAGVGRFLVKSLAVELGYAYVDFDGYFSEQHLATELCAADCAPAVAVAKLFLNPVNSKI